MIRTLIDPQFGVIVDWFDQYSQELTWTLKNNQFSDFCKNGLILDQFGPNLSYMFLGISDY